MKIIGLTGPTGSGKSTVAKQAAQLGFAVIDCDKEAKIVVENAKKFVLPFIEASTEELPVLIALASPAIIASFLIAPVPNYHNVMTLIGNIYKFFSGRKKYYWRGWCVSYGNNRNK